MTLTAGFTKACESVSGGVLQIWLANEADVTSMTLTGTEYSAIVMNGAAVFYEFQFTQDTAEIRENVARNDSGNISVTHELEFYLPKMSTTQRDAIQEIIDCSPCGIIAIAKDSNGNQWVQGYNETALKARPMRILTDTTTSGTSFSDSNGSTVVLQSIDGEKARVYTGTVPV